MHIPTETEANALKYLISAVFGGYLGGAAIGKYIKDKIQERRRAEEDKDEDGKIRKAEKRLHDLERTISPDDDYIDKDEWEIIEERNVAILAMRHYRKVSQMQHERAEREHARAERYRKLYEDTMSGGGLTEVETPADIRPGRMTEFRAFDFFRRPLYFHWPRKKPRKPEHDEERYDRP